jgi:hypothetical protein
MSWDHVYFALLHDLDTVIISGSIGIGTYLATAGGCGASARFEDSLMYSPLGFIKPWTGNGTGCGKGASGCRLRLGVVFSTVPSCHSLLMDLGWERPNLTAITQMTLVGNFLQE